MTESSNPYEAPRAQPVASDDSAADGVRNGALFAFVSDVAHSVAWRCTTSFAMLFPDAFGVVGGRSRLVNLGIKCIGAACLVPATRILTRPARRGLAMPPAQWTRVAAVVSLALHGLRFAFEVARSDWLVSWLEPVTEMSTAVTITGVAWCVASYFAEVGRGGAARAARLVGWAYLVGSAGTACVSLSVAPGIPRAFRFLGAMRVGVSTLFILLAVVAGVVLARIRQPASEVAER